jgi:hypothetical protein
LTSGQLRALHAKADRVDKAREWPRGTAKKQALAAASQQFGRDLSSVRELSEDEASWLLDLLEEEQERS